MKIILLGKNRFFLSAISNFLEQSYAGVDLEINYDFKNIISLEGVELFIVYLESYEDYEVTFKLLEVTNSIIIGFTSCKSLSKDINYHCGRIHWLRKDITIMDFKRKLDLFTKYKFNISNKHEEFRKLKLRRIRPLTPSEILIIHGLVNGLDKHELAEVLRVSVKTINAHLYNIGAKYGTRRNQHMGLFFP